MIGINKMVAESVPIELLSEYNQSNAVLSESVLESEIAPTAISPVNYSNFLAYSGTETFYFADVSCDRLVSAAEKPYFQILLKQTQLAVGFWAGPPVFKSVKISVTSPNGRVIEYKFSDGKKDKGTDLSCVLFNSDILIEDGTYTVQASGTITAGAEAKQGSSFTFVYDSTPPKGTLSVDSGGISNSMVVFNANEGKLYYSRSNDSIPSSANTHVASNTITYGMSDAGYYRLKLEDAAGNDSQYTFIIDKTAPELTLSGVTNNGFTAGSVSASWSTTVGGITAQRVSSSDTLTVKYSYSTTATFPTSATTNYTAGTALTEPGNYLLEITDKAGNKSQYKFTIDKTAPKLSLLGVTENGFTNGNVTVSWSTSVSGITGQCANGGDDLTVKYSYNTTAAFPTSATDKFINNLTFTAPGNYLLEISDKAGNKSQYKFTIDRTAPTLSLSGVTENGFTNGTVHASWSTTASGITGQLSNSNDGVNVKYSYNTTATFPTSALSSYSAATDLTAVGNYLLTITDKAGNSRSFKFTIDKTAPALTLSGLTDGFTNGNVTASWATSVDGVRGQLSNRNDRLSVKYSYSTTATFPTSATSNYTAGTVLSAVGNYLLTIEDLSGNINRYTFTIDRLAPTLTLSGVTIGGITKSNVTASWSTAVGGITAQLSNDSDRLTVKYSYLGGLEFPATATREYTNGNLTVEGNYLLIITDKSGNSTSYTFTIDKTAPSVTVMPEKYTNSVVSYAAEDLHGVASVEFRLNGGEIGSNVGSRLTIEAVPSNFGVWEIRSIDTVGNVSSWQTVNLLIRSGFGNLEDARNEYKAAAWYTVTLSAKNFPAIAGKYSFETYDAALSFAVQKEWEYRVVTLSNGTWSYTNIANSSVTQIYTNRAELDVAINKYATANVSARSVLKTSGGAYYSPTDENGVVRPDALTKQNIALPGILSEYANLPLILIGHNYIFRTPDEVLAGNISSFVLSYLSDGITLQSGISKTFSYGNTIKDMLEPFAAWQQGYYLVSETDLCGNVDRYIVYLDIDTPGISAEAQIGDDSVTTINFDAAYVAANKDVMLYTGLKLDRITDNMDEFAMLMIDGRGLSEAVYLDGDELPHLCYENGYYGKYTITIYDRSYNALSFNVTIAGAPPTIKNSSLTNETRCRITIAVSDSNNAITSVKFYKVSYTGEYAPMYADDDGVTISPLTLEYSLRTGGKYVVVVTDIFGREVQSEPLFYMKGLPSGTLSGVKQNGVTNSTVTFTFENTNKIIIYIFDGGRWVTADNKAVVEERSSYNVATIASSEENSYQYKIFLYVADDMNLFVEYIFEIDAIPPAVEILTDEGRIDAETVTRLPFRVTWSEYGYTAYYYNKSSSMGELSKTRYTKDTVLGKAGTYVFEIKDQAGNLITFNVTVDNSVSYTIDGNYSILSDGSYISKNSITLTVTEMTSKWECESSNGIKPDNGQRITTDGAYRFYIEDLYGNVLEITLIIDNLPPEPVITTSDGVAIEKGGRTNKAFAVTCDEENVVIAISADGRTYVAYNGASIEAEGTHYFKLTDRMGNATTFSIRLDLTVDYTVTGKYIAVENGYVAQYITLTVNEEYSAFNAVSNNGVVVELGKRITAEGVYTLMITDLAGNNAEVVITIDLTPPTPAITTESGKTIQPNGKTNEAFSVACDEPGASLYLAVGSSYKVYDGELLRLSGKYTFRALDAIGNELIFSVEIDGGVSYAVGGKFTTDSKGQYVSNTWLSLTVTEDYISFVVTSNNGRTFISGEKIVYEGVYSVTVTDLAGNVETVGIIIDFTPPEPRILTLSGAELLPNTKTNEAFTVACGEDMATIELSRNGQSYTLYDSSMLREPATYYFRLTDLAGNTLVFTVTLDSGVDFTVSGTYKKDDQGRYVSLSGLTVTVGEEYRVFDVISSNGILFGSGERISDEGVYTVRIIDLAENVVQLVIVIDKTPPAPIITTETSKTVEQNGATNEAFTVKCFEQYVTIYWSRRNADYVLYDGANIVDEGKYYFKLIDFIGNSNIFTVTVDKTVRYTLKGLYKTVEPNVYATNAGVILTIDEPYSLFDAKTDDGQAVVLGEKIVREGRYLITITDEVGNVIKISLHVDYTAPVIALDGVDVDGITGQNVTVSIDDFKTAYYQVYGSSERIALLETTVFNMAGKYTIVAEDHAGNRSSVAFTIDGEVSITVSQSIMPRQIVIGSIEFKFHEKMSSSLLARDNGELVAFEGGRITENGVYILTVTDLYGNTAIYSWTILPAVAQKYSIPLPEGYAISVLKNGSVYMGAINDGRVELMDNGDYELTFNSGNGNYIVALTVDNVKPTVEITQEKNMVIIAQPSKKNVTFELTLNGEAVKFEIGKALTAVGDYTLTVTDEYGNQSVYTFTLQYMNTFSIVVIVIAAIAAVGIVAIMLVTRFKQKVK